MIVREVQAMLERTVAEVVRGNLAVFTGVEPRLETHWSVMPYGRGVEYSVPKEIGAKERFEVEVRISVRERYTGKNGE